MENDADLVVGSRYVGDGDSGGLSSWVRELVSQGSGHLSKALFPRRLKDITDPMSGLFLVRRSALDLDTFDPIGFKILLEIAVREAPLRVVEVPYAFAARHAGTSKASLREGFTFVQHLLRLRTSVSGAMVRLFNVGVVGLTGIAVNTAALWLLHERAGLGVALAALGATQLSTAWNFALIDGIVYRHEARGSWLRSFATFALLNNVVLLLRLPVMSLFVASLGMDYLLANVATLVLAFAARFAIVERTIYGKGPHVNTTPTASEPTSVAPPPASAALAEAAVGGSPALSTAPPAWVRRPVWLDHQYDIPGLARVCSQVQLPELEHFQVPARPGPHDIEIRVGEVGGPMRARARISAADGVTVYEEHLGRHGSSFRVEMGSPLHVTIGPLLAMSPHVVYCNIVEALLRFAAVTKDKILLHSACLEVGGTGVMLSARTDTGKTGTILRLLREQGATFLSDDMTIVDRQGMARTFPKPLTISQHTLRAVEADDLTAREWRRLRLQSRLHSREGRGIGMWLAKSNLPIMAMNAVTQRIVPPPKYTAGRLVPCVTAESVQVQELFIIQRSDPLLEAITLDDAVVELLENTDDAYGFPPFAKFAPTIVMNGMGWHELRAREEQILRDALSSGIRVRRLGSASFDWADRIPQLLRGAAPVEVPAPRVG
jgi:putative flippase GtrA